ncbi:MAG: hypothetical protein J0M12_12060 [Deltaproteobacteria bacterium]|nr:hypothetical protein [Deltaproteobacteria bacterium]
MKNQQTATVADGNVCVFPTIVHSESLNHQQLVQTLELRRLVSYLLYAIKDIACAQTEPLRVLACIASGDEISPALQAEVRADLKACAHARIKELGERAQAHLQFLEKAADW